MTRKEMETALGSIMATLAAQNGPVIAPAAVSVPVAPSNPSLPDWVTSAQAAQATPKAATKPAAVKAPKAPLPFVYEVITINPDPTKGQLWSSFKMLHVHNQRSGLAYRGARLDSRGLGAVIAFLQAGGKL